MYYVKKQCEVWIQCFVTDGVICLTISWLEASPCQATGYITAWRAIFDWLFAASCDTSSCSSCWFPLPDDVIALWQECFFRLEQRTSHLCCSQTQCCLKSSLVPMFLNNRTLYKRGIAEAFYFIVWFFYHQKQTEANVRNKILYLIQAWAHAFRNEPKYKVVQDTYQIMKVEGKRTHAVFDFGFLPLSLAERKLKHLWKNNYPHKCFPVPS